MAKTPIVTLLGLWPAIACSSGAEPTNDGNQLASNTTSLSAGGTTGTTAATTVGGSGPGPSGIGGATSATTSSSVVTSAGGATTTTQGGIGGTTPLGDGGGTPMGGLGGTGGGVGNPTTTTGGGGTTSGGEKGPSAGCGTQTSLSSGNATIDVSGSQREYILKLPDNYDSSTPHKLIFGLHWLGGQASDVTSGTVGLGDYYGLEALAQGSAVFVAPNGIENGWANSGGRDIEFMRALVDLFSNELCIDLDRIFSVGFSYGGMMSFAIACEMADTFRAIAPLSGALYSGCGNGTEPIAMWGAHGTSDNVVPIGDGRSGLAEVLERNHCGEGTMPVEPSPCVAYEGCDTGYPVTWCEFDGGHGPQQWQVQPIWDFFSQF